MVVGRAGLEDLSREARSFEATIGAGDADLALEWIARALLISGE